MPRDRENNRRKRTRYHPCRSTSMLANIINNVSTCLIQRINKFRDFCTTYELDNISHHDYEVDDDAPRPPKRRCIRTSRHTNDPRERHHEHNSMELYCETDSIDSREAPYVNTTSRLRQHERLSSNSLGNRNVNSNFDYVYPLTSTANRKRKRRVMTSTPPVSSITRPTIDEANDIDWSANNSGNVQYSQDNTRGRAVISQDPGPSGSRINHYKTRNLVLPSQATIVHVKNITKPPMIPMVTSTSEISEAEARTPPIETASVPPVYEWNEEPSDRPMPQESVLRDTNVFTHAEPSPMLDDSVIVIDSDSDSSVYQDIPNSTSGHHTFSETTASSFDKAQFQTITVVTKTSGESPSRDKQNESAKFNKIVLASREKWECAMCLVRNERSTSKCVCCGSLAPNSGTNKENSVPSFNFGFISRLDFQTDKNNSSFLLKNTLQQTSSNPSTPSPVDIDPTPVFSFAPHNADDNTQCNPSPLDVDNPPPPLVLNTVPPIDSNPPPAININPAPTQLPIPTSPLLKSPNTSSSALTNIENIVNSNLVFGATNTNIENLDSNRERMMNTFDMQMPVNESESTIFHSSMESRVNVFKTNTAQGNNLFELLKTNNEANNVFGIIPQAGAFGQPAKREPTVGLVFNFGQPQPQLQQEPQQEPQPMQIQPQQEVTAISMSQPISAQEMIQQPMGSQAMGLQPIQPNVYTFGATQTVPQFNMGSSPSNTHTVNRKVRRAVRRSNMR